MPTFSRGVIHRFSNNALEMKRLAARDFEDLLQADVLFSWLLSLLTTLQCSVPAFEGLLPRPHNRLIMTVLYHCTKWHALAKLHIHTKVSLSLFNKASRQLGHILRKFRDETT